MPPTLWWRMSRLGSLPISSRTGNKLLLLPVGDRRAWAERARSGPSPARGRSSRHRGSGGLSSRSSRRCRRWWSGAIVSCHDVSDGGLIVTLLEMAFAGEKGWRVSVEGRRICTSPVRGGGGRRGGGRRRRTGAPDPRSATASTAIELGCVQDGVVELSFNQGVVLREPVRGLHATWEETGYQLERLQANPECAEQEWLSHRSEPAHGRTVSASIRMPTAVAPARRPGRPPEHASGAKPRAAILREEGSNGDREMAAAFLAAGFEPWDVTMTDLINGAIESRGLPG